MYESWFEVSDVAVATQEDSGERGRVLTRVMKTMLAMKLT
jgi:hypothetical protein